MPDLEGVWSDSDYAERQYVEPPPTEAVTPRCKSAYHLVARFDSP